MQEAFMADPPFVSIVIPCRDEAEFIGACLESVIANDYPQERLEVFIVDGRSDDGTREIVAGYAQKYPFIRLLDNPRRVTPVALNIGLDQARGDIFMRMDAHTVYPRNYIGGLVGWLHQTDADNVGGVWLTLPGQDTPMARAIALVLAHPLGVGNAYFRIGTDKLRAVDTVPFGCYRREVFDRIGRFDERLERNQDIEFNARLRQAGGRIYLVPAIFSSYYARSSLKDLWQNNFQNGCWNIYCLAVNKMGLSVRHLTPLLFISTLLLGIILRPFSIMSNIFWDIMVISYITLILATSLVIAVNNNFNELWRLPSAFFILHCSYGLGSLWGLLTVKKWRKTWGIDK